MKFKIFLIALCLSGTIVLSQERTKLSVFPFQNKSDKSYGWLSYGLSNMLTESMNGSGAFDALSQEQIYKATSDPEINLLSALEEKPAAALTKYQSSWNTNIFVVGNFTVASDSLILSPASAIFPKAVAVRRSPPKDIFRIIRLFIF